MTHPPTREPERGIRAYRALPRIAGWSFLFATALGRLPLSMVPLAILTLVTSTTGSIALGGLAAAAAAIGEAVGAPVSGWLADAFGQRVVLLTAVVLHVSALIAVTFGSGVVADPLTVALSGAAGFTLPQVGALSRARWLAIATDDLPTAFAFEGVIDEIVYIFGPALVGLTAAFVSPQAAVLLAGVLIAVFATQFATHRTHRAVPRRQARDRDASITRPRPRVGLIAIVFVGMISMGMFFGGSQTGLTAFAATVGIPDAGALLYAVMAVGSAGTTMAMVLVPERIALWTRWAIAAAGMTIGTTCMLLAPSIPTVIAAALLAGAFQGPLLLTIYGVVGTLAEAGRAGALLTFVASGVVVGIGIGSAVAGALAQSFGAAGAFSLVVGASLVLLTTGVAGLVRARALRARTA